VAASSKEVDVRATATKAAKAATGSGEAKGKGVDAGEVGLPSEGELNVALSKIMAEIGDPAFKKTLEDTLSAMSRTDDAGGAGLFGGIDGGEGTELDGNVTKTLDMLQKLSMTTDSSDEARKIADDVMSQMTEEFEKMGQKEDFQSVIDNMMRQLLARDVMYEPMKQICEMYPTWLAENVSKLSTIEYETYGKQFQLFQQLTAVYETEPDNFPRLMELMHDLQETGQPPAEIVKKLAPGLDLGEDGLPTLPNMGAGLPTLPGMPAGACTVM
jgi:peroxin-19